jgi:hypothetical protein
MESEAPLREFIRPGTHVNSEHGFTLLAWHDEESKALVCPDDGWGVIVLTKDDITDRLGCSEKFVVTHYDLDTDPFRMVNDEE